jgi:hypothetical protein
MVDAPPPKRRLQQGVIHRPAQTGHDGDQPQAWLSVIVTQLRCSLIRDNMRALFDEQWTTY